MTWIGGVKRYCPVFSKFCHWSWRSSTSVVALPLRLGEHGRIAEHEAQPRHALDALVRGGRDRIEARLAAIERQRAEGRHGIEQEAAAVLSRELADLGDRD